MLSPSMLIILCFPVCAECFEEYRLHNTVLFDSGTVSQGGSATYNLDEVIHGGLHCCGDEFQWDNSENTANNTRPKYHTHLEKLTFD